jgi:hypothetical protein
MRCPLRLATFERIDNWLMQSSDLHHIEFLRGKKDSRPNLESECIPGLQKKGVFPRFDD